MGMEFVGTLNFCWNVLEHVGTFSRAPPGFVGTLNLFRRLLERSNEMVRR